jgi:hypothetical protein
MQLLAQCIQQRCARFHQDRPPLPVDESRHRNTRRRLLGRINRKRQCTGYGHATGDEPGAFDELASVNRHSQYPCVIESRRAGRCFAASVSLLPAPYASQII